MDDETRKLIAEVVRAEIQKVAEKLVEAEQAVEVRVVGVPLDVGRWIDPNRLKLPGNWGASSADNCCNGCD